MERKMAARSTAAEPFSGRKHREFGIFSWAVPVPPSGVGVLLAVADNCSRHSHNHEKETSW